MRTLNTLIEDYQKEWLDKNSVTRANSRAGNGLMLSEHVRKALDMYIEKEKENANE